MSKGIVSSVVASCMFAVMYFYTSLLRPLDGEEIFGWRTLLTLPCLTLFMLVSKDWKRVGQLLGRVRRELEIDAQLADLFRHPTVEALATHLLESQ